MSEVDLSPVEAAPAASPYSCHPALADPARRQALVEAGLTAASDPVMEAFARRVRTRVDVPVALVSLVFPDEQVFPGMAGLPEPWATDRSTPLTHSFCQHVVVSAEPLIVRDARDHPLVRDNLAVPDIGVVAYAGIPLTDEAGNVLGSLCAIDTRPREWTAYEIELLQEIADACATELRLRLTRFTAQVEREQRDALEQRLRRSVDRSRALLVTAQAFVDTVTVDDVRIRAGELFLPDLQPSYVGMALLDERGRMRRLPDARLPPSTEDTGPWVEYDVTANLPSARAVRERRLVVYTDRSGYDADHDEAARTLFRQLGLHAVVVAPLLDTDGATGSIVFGWDAPRTFDAADLVTITTIAGFAAQALDRARRLQHRVVVAQTLQQAMLTTLPATPRLETAALYRAADIREFVGGDWYDLAPLPGSDGELLVLSVGDIMGHDLNAATVMGQARSMLRQAAWDHPGRPPSVTLEAFERASAGLAVHATGTAVVAQLRRGAAGNWLMTWTNAGHPPPVLLTPDGRTTLLDAHDVLFGFPALVTAPRRDHRCDLAPGSTVVLYTDGLVERRGSDIDTGIANLMGLLDTHRDRGPADLVELAVGTLAADSTDDVVALAVRVP